MSEPAPVVIPVDPFEPDRLVAEVTRLDRLGITWELAPLTGPQLRIVVAHLRAAGLIRRVAQN